MIQPLHQNVLNVLVNLMDSRMMPVFNALIHKVISSILQVNVWLINSVLSIIMLIKLVLLVNLDIAKIQLHNYANPGLLLNWLRHAQIIYLQPQLHLLLALQ